MSSIVAADRVLVMGRHGDIDQCADPGTMVLLPVPPSGQHVFLKGTP
jgi:hypothetical protein